MFDDDLLLLMGGSGLTPVVHNAPAGFSNFTVPAGVTSLIRLEGRGQDGDPPVGGDWGYDIYETVTTKYADGSETVSGPTYIDTVYYEAPPQNSCTMGGGSYPRVTTCTEYAYFDNSYPGSTGQATSGFGYNIPGGSEGPASPMTFSNVAVTPNQSYSIYVAPGGYLTFTYWK